jgi:Dolichyl-phosphate-mannose-protein mannosyltransferase
MRGALRGRSALVVLALLLAGGVAIRVAYAIAYQPALVGYPDTHAYLVAAREELFWPTMQVVGYPVVLRALHDVVPSLAFVVLVQHALGIATALLLWAAARRVTGSPWPGLVPAAIVLVGGDQALFEHAILSESLFAFLIASAIYAAARCLDAGRMGWVVATGLLLGLAGTVRVAGVALVPLLGLWLLLVPAPSWRRRLAVGAAGFAAGAAVLGGYLIAAHDRTGAWSFSRNGAYNLYGRVGPFADCTRFAPPPGTAKLCETTPRAMRSSPQWYVFDWGAPAKRHYGDPQVGGASREEVAEVGAFARAVVLAQPGDWLSATLTDFERYVAPWKYQRLGPTPTARDYHRLLVHPLGIERVTPDTRGWYDDAFSLAPGNQARVDDRTWVALGDWQLAASIEGPIMLVLLLLIPVGLVAGRSRERLGVLLVGGTSLTLLLIPVATLNYDGRFGVPVHGPVAAAAAIGALGLARRAAPLAARVAGRWGSARAPATAAR